MTHRSLMVFTVLVLLISMTLNGCGQKTPGNTEGKNTTNISESTDTKSTTPAPEKADSTAPASASSVSAPETGSVSETESLLIRDAKELIAQNKLEEAYALLSQAKGDPDAEALLEHFSYVLTKASGYRGDMEVTYATDYRTGSLNLTEGYSANFEISEKGFIARIELRHSDNNTETYLADANGNIISLLYVTDKGVITRGTYTFSEYDDLLTAHYDYSDGTSYSCSYEYTYNENGEILAQIYQQENNFSLLINSYDSETGRLIKQTSLATGIPCWTATYEYDADGNLFLIEERSSVGSTRLTKYAYDTNGNMIRSEFYSDGKLQSTHESAYDQAGNLLEDMRIYLDGDAVEEYPVSFEYKLVYGDTNFSAFTQKLRELYID